MKSKLRSIEKYRSSLSLKEKSVREDHDTILLELEHEREEKNNCLKKLSTMVEANRVVQDMEDLENDLNEKVNTIVRIVLLMAETPQMYIAKRKF